MPLGEHKINYENIIPMIRNKFLSPLRTIYQNQFQSQVIREKTLTPIYHIHIPKTGGTTINYAFLSWFENKPVDSIYSELCNNSNNRIINEQNVFVGWNERFINQGKYTYAFSHAPIYDLNLPNNIFKFTCLRDPLKRVLSYYNMLRYYQINNIKHGLFTPLYSSFEDFLNRVEKKDLCSQLYMFSKKYDYQEAIDNVLKCDYYFFTEDLANGLINLENRFRKPLPIHMKKYFGYTEDIPMLQLERVKEMLIEEYKMVDFLRLSNV